MKIMLCYDGSEESKDALQEAGSQARAFGGTVLIVTSVRNEHASNLEPYEMTQKEGTATLEALQVPCNPLLSIRPDDMQVGEDFVNVATREAVDKIVIGIKSRSKVGKFVFGSEAQYLILNAYCPVITVRKK